MKKVKVLFVMMAYNTEKYVKKAIESVLNQTEKDIAFIVRDNGSTDNTGKILDEIDKKDDRLFVIHNNVNGVGDNGEDFYTPKWWTGQYNIEAEYVSIIDSDDFIEPDFVEKLYFQAKENNADIVAAGNYFVNESGKKLSKRTAKNLVTDNMADIDKDYNDIYNIFRTWWGKLFKSSLFWENYVEIWKPEYPMERFLDTILMFKYLSECKMLVIYDDPLYNMYIRPDSTYSTRIFETSVIQDACALYNNNKCFLKKFNIDNTKNNLKIIELHWAYIREAYEAEIKNPNIDRSKRFYSLESIFRDRIVETYFAEKHDMLLATAYKLVSDVFAIYGEEYSDYKYYIVRYKKFMDIIEKTPNSSLNFFILAGIMTDKYNPLNVGYKYKWLFYDFVSKGVKEIIYSSHIYWTEFAAIPNIMVNTSNLIDYTHEVKGLEVLLNETWDNGDYEKAIELINEITSRCLFSFDAMYYRIHLAIMIKDYEYAALLCYSACSIWPDSQEFKELSLYFEEVE
ncbi:glycosyltransferase family 2 protein [Clostridium butyricum]|uniref:glycosyltransferase family 2 protein n=1 Tax=Clostridium butyricum TaxID=1492 RepID=UPI0021025337|nr:glycosyltransferase family 2 protein [Clostridium butyricum]MCQ2018547.1 glycosyltransferase family 2 protein [Clostridium butyricum]UTY52218.1 glycosyltransferase family 2 protein [Clostridium butyricum]